MDDEKCTIFDLDIMIWTKDKITQTAALRGNTPDEAVDLIVYEWSKTKVSNKIPDTTVGLNNDFLLNTTSLSDDIADKVIQRLKDEFVLTTE